jgi:hypothetical protein
MVSSGHPGLAQVVAGTPWLVLVSPVAALYCCTSNPEPADPVGWLPFVCSLLALPTGAYASLGMYRDWLR